MVNANANLKIVDAIVLKVERLLVNKEKKAVTVFKVVSNLYISF